MRRLSLRYLTLLLILAVLGTILWRFESEKLKAFSQGSNILTGTLYATYQYNTLKNPTGLAGVNWVVVVGYTGYANQYHIYVADSGNHVIRNFNTGNGSLSTVAGIPGSAGYVNSSLGSSKFNYPTGLTVEDTVSTSQGCAIWNSYGACVQPQLYFYNAQEIYVNDAQNNVVRRICTGDTQAGTGDCSGHMGQVVTACGTGAQGMVDGSSASAKFRFLGGMTDNGDGTCYMADAENHAIRSWDGASVNTFAGTGSYGYANGYRTSAQFNAPTKTTKDGSGNMYVADAGNHVIRKIDTAGNVTTLAGTGQPGYTDGSGGSAQFSKPTSVVFNPADNMLYVADNMNNMIRRVDLSGYVTTYAGTTSAGLVNGTLGAARFSGPTDILINNGFMYISDTMNNVIRRIDMAAGQVSIYIS
jgi:hypothetical protein